MAEKRVKSHLYGIEIWYILSFWAKKAAVKSHLYGIEIVFIGIEKDVAEGLNRTFMELK